MKTDLKKSFQLNLILRYLPLVRPPSPLHILNIEPEVEPDEDLGYDRIHYNGPRVGFTILNEGTSKDMLLERGNQPFIVQFGWQFETRLFSIENGPTGLV